MSSQVISTEWTSHFAYAVGLLTTDGSLSIDERHIDFTSKDLEQIEHLRECLGIQVKIGEKYSGSGKKSFRVQISNVSFYRFLRSIGLCSNKSLILGELAIPRTIFADFLRGHFDGDGSFYNYRDTRWKSSYMFYTTFASASMEHITWLQGRIASLFGLSGHITKVASNSAYQLKYAKQESLHLLAKMYYNADVVCLSRKRDAIKQVVALENARVA